MKIPETICSKCNKRVVTSEVRAGKDGKGWICIECYNRSKDVQSSMKGIPVAVPKNTTYLCYKCRHRFKGRDNYVGRCPFCGSDTVQKDITVNELLKSVDEVPDRRDKSVKPAKFR